MLEPKATASHLDSTRLRHADRTALCPPSDVTRKTYARTEFFSVDQGGPPALFSGHHSDLGHGGEKADRRGREPSPAQSFVLQSVLSEPFEGG